MMNVKLTSTLAVAASVALIAACAGTGTDSSSPLAPSAPRYVLTSASVGDAGDNTPNQGEVEICKYGTDAQFDVGPQGGSTTRFSITDGQCKVVVVDLTQGNTANNYTIQEVASSSYNLLSIQRTDIQFAVGTTTDIVGSPFLVNSEPVVAAVNYYHGVKLVYHNEPADEGCTYTQGWYKNPKHTWPAGTITRGGSFDGGASYESILNTPPKGNVYYILAHQYITALLNIQGGAGSSDITQALADAAAYFAAASPNNPLPGSYTQAQVTAIATILDEYNNGITGPGHCDDEVLTLQ